MNAKDMWNATKTIGAICGLVLAADKVTEKVTGQDLWDNGVELGKKIFSGSKNSGQNT